MNEELNYLLKTDNLWTRSSQPRNHWVFLDSLRRRLTWDLWRKTASVTPPKYSTSNRWLSRGHRAQWWYARCVKYSPIMCAGNFLSLAIHLKFKLAGWVFSHVHFQAFNDYVYKSFIATNKDFCLVCPIDSSLRIFLRSDAQVVTLKNPRDILHTIYEYVRYTEQGSKACCPLFKVHRHPCLVPQKISGVSVMLSFFILMKADQW